MTFFSPFGRIRATEAAMSFNEYKSKRSSKKLGRVAGWAAHHTHVNQVLDQMMSKGQEFKQLSRDKTRKQLIFQKEGSLTSSAEKIFFTDIQMEVFNTNSAVLDVNFLLLSISIVFDVALALVDLLHMSGNFL